MNALRITLWITTLYSRVNPTSISSDRTRLSSLESAPNRSTCITFHSVSIPVKLFTQLLLYALAIYSNIVRSNTYLNITLRDLGKLETDRANEAGAFKVVASSRQRLESVVKKKKWPRFSRSFRGKSARSVENCLKIERLWGAVASHDASSPDAGAAFPQLRRRLGISWRLPCITRPHIHARTHARAASV